MWNVSIYVYISVIAMWDVSIYVYISVIAMWDVSIYVYISVIAMWDVSTYEMVGESIMYGEKGEVYTGFWWGIQRERDHLVDPGIDGRIILRWVLRKWDVWAWTVSIWLRIGTAVGVL
jgi:hypothetical protein